MATSEILQFASQDTGSNLLTQAEYEGDAQRIIGHQPGIARSRLENKVLRQASLMAAGLAQFMADNQSGDITDGLSAQDIADALNLSLENKISSIGTGGIKLLQSAPITPPAALSAENPVSVAMELTADNGESIIAGAFRYNLVTTSQYQAGTTVSAFIGINITGATKTSGAVTIAPSVFTSSPESVVSGLAISYTPNFTSSSIRYGALRGSSSAASYSLSVGALFVAI